MSFYPPKISEKFYALRYVGRAAGANAIGTNATFVCGAAVRFTLRIDKNSKQIVEAKFQTNGCGYAMAAAEVLAEKISGKFLADLHGFDDSFLKREIENELEVFESNRQHCLQLTLETMHSAFADFRAAQLEEWAGEKALVCTCFGVSEETIERVIEDESAETIEEVTIACNAGGGCGSCQPLIQELIDVYWSEK